MAIREGRWDCQYCGSKKLLGRQETCLGCGHKRGHGTKFYLAEGEPEVVDSEQLRRAKIGSDWYCEHCQNGNRNDTESCSQCGANRDSSVKPGVLPQEMLAHTKLNKNSKLPWLIMGVLFILPVILYILWPKPVTIRATNFSWERSINIETYKTVTEEDWDIPNGGREIKHWTDIKDHISVLDHYEHRTRQVEIGERTYNCGSRDLGNGYFEDITCSDPIYGTESYDEPIYRNDPVYAIKYRYDIDKWIISDSKKASGNSREPYWPDLNLTKNSQNVLGSEREGERKEIYTVTFTSEEKKPKNYTERLDFSAWISFQNNQLYRAKRSFGKLSDITPLTE